MRVETTDWILGSSEQEDEETLEIGSLGREEDLGREAEIVTSVKDILNF